MSRVPISVCMIAKNEEKYIEECLKKLKPYGFEIIVTDTGSSDKTKEIAQKYADKVLDFEWIDDFSAARNFCASHASNNWILALDCDEYVNSIDMKVLRILMQKFPKYVGVIRLKNIVMKTNEQMGYGVDDVTRFYNRSHYTFCAPIHEQVTLIDESRREETMQCFLMPMEVIHHGYALSSEEMRKKQERNLELLYRQIENGQKDPYLFFQTGQSEYILKNYEKATKLFEQGLSMKPSPEKIYVQMMIMTLAKSYLIAKRSAAAVAIMEKYAEECKTAKYIYMHANALYEDGQSLKALLLYVKVTMMSDVDTLGEELMLCYERIIRLYTNMNNLQMAEIFKQRYMVCKKEKERTKSKTLC